MMASLVTNKFDLSSGWRLEILVRSQRRVAGNVVGGGGEELVPKASALAPTREGRVPLSLALLTESLLKTGLKLSKAGPNSG